MTAPAPTVAAARPWLKHLDYWAPHSLSYPTRPLTDILNLAAVEMPVRAATHFLGAELTFGELKRQSDRLAASLAEMGIVKGDRVGIMLPNCPQYIIAAFAILRIGAIVVNINPSYTAREYVIIAVDSGARLLVTLDALAPLAQGVKDRTPIERIVVTSLAEYSAAGAPAPHVADTVPLARLVAPRAAPAWPALAPSPFEIDSRDLAVLQYTGGTTGTPKGAMLTHGNVFANVIQTEAWTNPAYVYARNERYLVVIPYFHIYAFTVCMMTGVRVGALQIIHPKYDPDLVLASIRDLRPTLFPAVPTLFVSLLNHPKVSEYGLERVRNFNSGGAPCPVEVLEEWERRFGRPLNEGYGLSETSPVTHTTPQLARRRIGTIGLPLTDTDIKIVDLEHGTRELAAGEVGELCISGPQVMKGYWNKPEETAAALRRGPDGRTWLHTGDIASIDSDGFTSIVQRKKDMIIVDGFNVYPSEVESILYLHPAVRLAAVIGVPDKYHGEVVKACIALKPGATVTAAEMIEHCRTSLTEYKVPRQIEVRDTLPMSAVGKILYRVLREEHAALSQHS